MLVRDDSWIQASEIARLQISCARLGVSTSLFSRSEEVSSYDPGLVLSFSLQDAKLTKYPTYGVLNRPVDELAAVPRFVRNLLTYDAYLTAQPKVRRFLKDITFGARKLNGSIAFFTITSPMTAFRRPNLGSGTLVCNCGDERAARNGELIAGLKGMKYFSPFSAEFDPSAPLDAIESVHEHVLDRYSQGGYALILPNAENPEELTSEFFAAVSAGAVVIAPRNKLLESRFKDQIVWYDADQPVPQLLRDIDRLYVELLNSGDRVMRRAIAAHEIFCTSFSLEALLPNLFDLHSFILEAKGYIPSRDQQFEANLPSVTYIIRTGNRNKALLQRTLDSLVAQQYPHLVVLFVLWSKMPYLDEIRAEYPELEIRVVEDYGGRRSTGICSGMKAVTTDLFGLLDDDDELHPNHIRTMVAALRRHDNLDLRGSIGLVYSGSIEADVSSPRIEKLEWRDHFYQDRNEHRAVEHFRFYTSTQLASHQWYLFSFLARASIIDDELLDDPEMDTCEDLCLILQIGQKTHFAFSGEITAVHWYHEASSTRVDAHKHFADTRRIGDRNHGRYFPADFRYMSGHARFLDANYPGGFFRDPAAWPGLHRAGGASSGTEAVASAQGGLTVSGWRLLRAYRFYQRLDRHERERLRLRFEEYAALHGRWAALRRIPDYVRARHVMLSGAELGSPSGGWSAAPGQKAGALGALISAYRLYRRLDRQERERLRLRFREYAALHGHWAALRRIPEYARARRPSP